MIHEGNAVVPSWEQASGRADVSRSSARTLALLCKLAPRLAGLMLALDCLQLLCGMFGDVAPPAGGEWVRTAIELLTALFAPPAPAQANVRRTTASSAGRCWLTLRASASWLCARARL